MSDIQLALELRDRGIERAKLHADVTHDDWSTNAYGLFEIYVKYLSFEETFQIEDFRQWASGAGLPEPPHKRAFGFIPIKASKAGLIVKHGHAKVTNPTAHQAISTVWKRNKN